MRSSTVHKLDTLTTTDHIVEEDLVFFDSGCRRRSTADFHYYAIKNAITLMHEQYAEPLTLQDLADAAQLSPFHFNRIFHRTTGLSPTIFLSAIRLQQAKHLLMTTRDSVTDICFDVGYRSLGTFTSRFTALVGLPPSHYRRLLSERSMYQCPIDKLDNIQSYIRQHELSVSPLSKGVVSGTIQTRTPFQGLMLIGLFTSPLPQGLPVSCALLTKTGYFTLPPTEDGLYYVFCCAVDLNQSFLTTVVQGIEMHGSSGRQPIKVHNGLVKERIDITIAPASWIHPPVLTVLPWLLLSQLS